MFIYVFDVIYLILFLLRAVHRANVQSALKCLFDVPFAALGPIFFPYFITGLMSHYGAFGCILILGAISTHTIMAALLLQPVEWHMKKIPTTNVANKIDNNGSEQRTETSTGKPAQNRFLINDIIYFHSKYVLLLQKQGNINIFHTIVLWQ